jgi:hypothetical protein
MLSLKSSNFLFRNTVVEGSAAIPDDIGTKYSITNPFSNALNADSESLRYLVCSKAKHVARSSSLLFNIGGR